MTTQPEPPTRNTGEPAGVRRPDPLVVVLLLIVGMTVVTCVAGIAITLLLAMN